MNGKELLDKMSEVDPKLIEGAYKDAEESEKPKSRRALFIGLGSGMAAIAAALAVFIGVKAGLANKDMVGTAVSGSNINSATNGIDALPATNGNEENSADKGGIEESAPGTISMQSPESVNLTPEAVIDSDFSEYENLTVISNKFYGMKGMGGDEWRKEVGLYTVYGLNEPDTLETFSPWSLDAELTTLPVYLSNSTTPDVAAMTERVKSVAALLGVSESELEITNRGLNGINDFDAYRKTLEGYGLSEEEIEAEIDRVSRISGAQTSIEGKASGFTIYCDSAGGIKVWFKEPYPALREGYSLNIQNNPSPEGLTAAFAYLAEEYMELLDYKNPTVARYDGIFEYEYKVYEAEGDLTSQIVNYWLNCAKFLGNWDNPQELDSITVDTTANLEKLGDYPIYTAQQALWVMQSERVPEEVRMPAGADVVKVELEYKNLLGYTAVIPYYEFVVKTDKIDESSGELIYRHYMMPAVPEQFLDMTVEDYGIRA